MRNMVRVGAVIVMWLVLVTQTWAASLLEPVFRRNLTDVRLTVVYTPGGTSRNTLKKILAQDPVVKIVPGGYFNPAAKPLMNVDYTLVKGKVVTPYLHRKARPVILFSEKRGARIAWPNKQTRGFSRYEDEVYGLAGDSCCQKPRNALPRTIIGITKTTVSVFMVTATEYGARKFMVRNGYKQVQYLFMDGGTSVAASTKMPSHIVISDKTL